MSEHLLVSRTNRQLLYFWFEYLSHRPSFQRDGVKQFSCETNNASVKLNFASIAHQPYVWYSAGSLSVICSACISNCIPTSQGQLHRRKPQLQPRLHSRRQLRGSLVLAGRLVGTFCNVFKTRQHFGCPSICLQESCFEFLLIQQIEIFHTKFSQFSDDQNLAWVDLPMPKSWLAYPSKP